LRRQQNVKDINYNLTPENKNCESLLCALLRMYGTILKKNQKHHEDKEINHLRLIHEALLRGHVIAYTEKRYYKCIPVLCEFFEMEWPLQLLFFCLEKKNYIYFF